jgi:hypothetical protein
MIYLAMSLFFLQFSIHADLHNPFPSDANVLSQQGSLVAVKVIKGEPIKIFVLGREEATLDFSNLQLDANVDPANFSINVRRINADKSGPILKLTREKDHFIIDNPDTKDRVFTLEVTTKVKGKKEVFKFKVDNKLH